MEHIGSIVSVFVAADKGANTVAAYRGLPLYSARQSSDIAV